VYSMTPHAIRDVIVGGRTVYQHDQPVLVPWQQVLDGLHEVMRGWPQPLAGGAGDRADTNG